MRGMYALAFWHSAEIAAIGRHGERRVRASRDFRGCHLELQGPWDRVPSSRFSGYPRCFIWRSELLFIFAVGHALDDILPRGVRSG